MSDYIEKDYFYFDYLNGGGDDSSVNFEKQYGDSMINRDNTIRVYLNHGYNGSDKDHTSDRLLMVAPYVTPYEIIGANEWKDDSGGIGAFLSEFVSGFMQGAHKTIKGFGKNWQTAKRLFGSKGTQNFTQDTAYTPASRYNKEFDGSSINIPSNVSVTYFSSQGDFGWYKRNYDIKKGTLFRNQDYGISISRDVCPLKSMATDLVTTLVGNLDSRQLISIDAQDKKEQKLADMLNGSYIISTKAPGGYKLNPDYYTDRVHGGLTIYYGDDVYFTGLLPVELSIVPSRYLTEYNDWYYMTVSLTVTPGRLFTTNDITNWINSSNDTEPFPPASAKEEENESNNVELQTFVDNQFELKRNAASNR